MTNLHLSFAKTENMNSLPVGWRRVKLGEVCEINPRKPILSRDDSTLTSFVQMSAVDDIDGVIARPEQKQFSDVKKGYTYFSENDVIFAKITPCMENGKHAIARNLIDGIGFGSTEFHVIRPNQNIIAEWIWYFIRQHLVLQTATNFFTGSVGQQRVPDSFLRSLEIPLPPFEEQKQIAAQLNEELAAVAKARNASEEQVRAVRELPARYLRDVFDNIKRQKWPKNRLGDILSLRKEVIHPHDMPRGKSVFVGLEHIESHLGIRIGSIDVEMSNLTGRKPKFYKGDIVYGYLRPYLNKVWMAEFDGLCSVDQYVYKVNNEKADTNFVTWFMRSPIYLERAPIETTPGQLPRIRTDEVASVEIDLPPLNEQKRIVDEITERLKTTINLKNSLEVQLTEINRLPSVLLRRAFSGELHQESHL
jgi:type I restriction enzyme S subunit